MHSEIPRAGRVTVASACLQRRAGCRFPMTSRGFYLSILESYRNGNTLLGAEIPAQEGKFLWNSTGVVKKEKRLSRIHENEDRQRSRAVGLEALLLPSFNIRRKCLGWGLIIVAGLFCSKFITARPVCICGFMSCAAFWLNIYSFLTMKVTVFSSPACLAGAETRSLDFLFNSKALWDFRVVISTHKTQAADPGR